MDLLTHIFLPLTVVFVLKQDLFNPSWHLVVVGVFGIVSDFDKFLGYPGLLHSLVTLVPIGIGLLGVEYMLNRDLKYSPIATSVLWSHLVLDFVDGGPVPLLSPLVETGVGLTYPLRITFGSGLFGVVAHGPPVALRFEAPRSGFNTYGMINGFGVVSAFTFVIVFIGLRSQVRGSE